MEKITYFSGIGTAVSQLAHAIIGGHPDMSLSSRAHLCKQNRFWWWVWLIAETLFREGHCESAWMDDVQYAHDVLKIDRDGYQ